MAASAQECPQAWSGAAAPPAAMDDVCRHNDPETSYDAQYALLIPKRNTHSRAAQ